MYGLSVCAGWSGRRAYCSRCELSHPRATCCGPLPASLASPTAIQPTPPAPSPAELLTTDKLSEMSCLALFLMYEKKLKDKSFWHPFIQVG